MDGDGEMISARYVRVPSTGTLWTGLVRYTKVNQGGVVPDPHNSVAPGPEEWWSIDLQHRRDFHFGSLELGIGADGRDRDWNDTDAVLFRAYLTFQHEF
jgi:hypothetical protein